ncbi:MAG TPA: nickel-dependent lactate racemase [Bacteroidota bacterium]|nr:nickel-dependent lactate racemase [Bacteroidota bacterium]
MKASLAYGKGWLDLELPGVAADVIRPTHQPGLSDERAAVLHALEQPIEAEPLRDWLRPECKVCITFTDLTRATPNERIIPWLLEYLANHGVHKDQILLLNQLGTHRPNTRQELEQILTPEVVNAYRVINHEPENPKALVQLGTTESGTPALINRHFVEADVRIVTGFIEPHLFAGFSGGVKGIMPGVAGLETVMSNHGYTHIADPSATFGITNGNPVWEELRNIALRVGKSFLLNVSLNNERKITGVFAGHLVKSHAVGCEFVRRSAMQRVDAPYDVVVTTNSGYPLDLNLYQTAKGIAAAARIIKKGGTIIVASECSDGIPAKSPFERLLHSAENTNLLLERLHNAKKHEPDQWQAQIQANCQRRAKVMLFSELADDVVRGAHLEPCHDIAHEVLSLARTRSQQSVAILPVGPLTIPYLAHDN